MADEISCTKGVSYRLRAGQAQAQKGCPAGLTTGFVMQTFGGEKRVTRVYYNTTQIAESNDMIGLNPEAELESANYQGTNYMSKEGELVLTGQEVEIVEYVREEGIPGVSNFRFI
jgi:hypothetical protein